MENNQITENVRIKVREYLIHLQKYANQSSPDLEQEVIQKLSQNLKDELRQQVNEKMYQKLKFLKGYFSDKTIKKIIDIIEEVNLLPGQYIYNQIQTSQEDMDNNLYFIVKGEGSPASSAPFSPLLQ